MINELNYLVKKFSEILGIGFVTNVLIQPIFLMD